jgi:hypothetical protein
MHAVLKRDYIEACDTDDRGCYVLVVSSVSVRPLARDFPVCHTIVEQKYMVASRYSLLVLFYCWVLSFPRVCYLLDAFIIIHLLF